MRWPWRRRTPEPLVVYMEVGDPVMATCARCGFDSRATGDLLVLRDSGVSTAGWYTACVRCDVPPDDEDGAP